MKRSLWSGLSAVEHRFDDFAFELRKRFGLDGPLQVVNYRTYGTTSEIFIKGRVLEDKGISESMKGDSLVSNLVKMYQRFASDEVPGATVKVDFEGKNYRATTDREGYFQFRIKHHAGEWSTNQWLQLPVVLEDAPLKLNGTVQSTASVLIPEHDAEYGIISDIDDTIIKTTATSLLAMSRNTFMHNAHTRLPFAGVAEFYKALQMGRNGKRNNPFFYVSSSPWNLYDLLEDFLDINDIPEGPLLLRDFGLDEKKAGSSDHMSHKFSEIKSILDTYPNLPFILIGDSGQEDPSIYREVVKHYPGRILSIYFRDVQLAQREKVAIGIKESMADSNVEMIIIDNTVEAARHAATKGFIFSESIPQVEHDKALDNGEAPGKEEMK